MPALVFLGCAPKITKMWGASKEAGLCWAVGGGLVRARPPPTLLTSGCASAPCGAILPSTWTQRRVAATRQAVPHAILGLMEGGRHGTAHVAASYKPPMLVTRVRLPACACFSPAADHPFLAGGARLQTQLPTVSAMDGPALAPLLPAVSPKSAERTTLMMQQVGCAWCLLPQALAGRLPRQMACKSSCPFGRIMSRRAATQEPVTITTPPLCLELELRVEFRPPS